MYCHSSVVKYTSPLLQQQSRYGTSLPNITEIAPLNLTGWIRPWLCALNPATKLYTAWCTFITMSHITSTGVAVAAHITLSILYYCKYLHFGLLCMSVIVSGVRGGGSGERPPSGLKTSGQTLFSGQAQKSWKIKNISLGNETDLHLSMTVLLCFV